MAELRAVCGVTRRWRIATRVPVSARCLRIFVTALVLLTGAFGAYASGADGAGTNASGASGQSPLAAHVSPYLRGHAKDPVDWQVWGEAALSEARAQGKLILVSVGYFACHWCHVMQRETFQDPGSASAINAATVPIKVDRELRPALDAHLIDFVERTTGRAGWPLNVILTPDGLPLVGFTYLRTGDFERVLANVQARWEAETETLEDLAVRADARLRELRKPAGRLRVDRSAVSDLWRRLLAQIMTAGDPVNGGFGQQTKFPSVPQLSALVAASAGAPVEEVRRRQAFLHLTLSRMATQGLRDQLGGGFFRYTTDVTWKTPHYEKMLYDNALLASLYADAAEALDEPAYARYADDTLAFMVRELWDARGAFISSLSAVDVDDVEGGYYFVGAEQLIALPAELQTLVAEMWGVTGQPQQQFPVQRSSVTDVAAKLDIPVAQVRANLATARRVLLAERKAERLPRDDKLLSGWNGLALSALIRSSTRVHEVPARALAATLSTKMWDGQRLFRALHGERAAGAASLQDYAYVGAGLLDAAEHWQDAVLLRTAGRVIERGWQLHFSAQTNGGWTRAPADVIALAQPVTALSDRSRPAASAVLLEATRRVLAHDALSADARTRLRGHYTLATSVVDLELAETPFFYASHILALTRRFDIEPASGRDVDEAYETRRHQP